MRAKQVFDGSDGEMTKHYYALLRLSGPIGDVAMNLFRAQKCSTRAKKYRGGIRGVGSFRSMAYDRKNWSMGELCKALLTHPHADIISFGWKRDPGAEFGPSWVLYVDLPEGQVSFHSPNRGEGPDYPGDWDKQRKSEERILAFCDRIVAQRLNQGSLALESA